MSRYPIKMLKDEEGQPFVPLTHINAVTGAKYVQAIFETTKIDNTHYQILSDDLTINDIRDKFIVVRFGETKKSNATSYIKMNSGTSYPIVGPDGDILEIGDLSNSVCLFNFTNDKWVTIGSTSGGGHKITDTEGNIMAQRSVLNFTNFTVEDDAGNGATKIVNDSWVKKITGITGDIEGSKYIPLCNAINIEERGTYKVDVMIRLNDIKTSNREIGIGDNSGYCWNMQYKRFAGTYSFIVEKNVGDTINPVIYIDKITSSDDINIKYCYIYIEKLNKID